MKGRSNLPSIAYLQFRITFFVLCLLAAFSSATAGAAQDVFVSTLEKARAAETAVARLVVTVPEGTPADASIFLAGSSAALGDWKADGLRLDRQDDGTYLADVTLDVGATLEFKITRGSWETVEKFADGGERPNRSLTVGAAPMRLDLRVERWADSDQSATAPTTQVDDQAASHASTVVGTLRLHELDSKLLGTKRTLRVWLPPGYDASPDSKFDVLYLHDGQNCFDRATSAFGHEWEIDETLTKLIDAKRIRPLIVVGIDNGGAKRIDELTFAPDPKHGGGHAQAYTTFLLDEVRPFIESHYRVNAGREHTFLGGSSLGGLASLEIARRHPGAFAGAIAMSPSLWWRGGEVITMSEADAAGLRDTRVWLDMGTREEGDDASRNALQVDNARRMDAALTKQHVEHRLLIDEGASHNEQAWAKRFGEAITYLLHE